MTKRITTILLALAIGSSAAAIGVAALGGETAAAPAAAPARVARLTPKQACEVTYINYPRRHWCDRKGRVHWL